AILLALFFTGVIQILSEQIAFNAFFGAVVFLLFFWRRLTPAAILMGVTIWVIVFGLVPWSVPQIDSLRHHQHLLTQTKAGSACFFDKIARDNPADPASPLAGIGRFRIETYLLSLVGVPVQNFPSAALLAARWAVDGVFPFIMLILFSLVTRRGDAA